MATMRLWFRVLWFLYVCARHCMCLCPEGLAGFTDVLTCLQNITHGLNGMSVLAGTTTSTIKHYCQDGTFNETVSCLTGLYSQCNHQRGQELLRQIAKPYQWQQGVNMICSNLKEHEKFSDCIVHQRSDIYNCLQYNDKMFMREAAQPRDWQKITFNICRYYTGMRICTGKQVKDKCSLKVGTLLENYFAAITPLLCHDNVRKRNNSGFHRLSDYMIVMSLTVSTISFLYSPLNKT